MKQLAPPFLSSKILIFKSLRYLLSQDKEGLFWRFFAQNPLLCLSRFFGLFFRREEKISQGGYFFHGLNNLIDLERALCADNTYLFIGLSYCQKPFDCPSQRFSEECRASSHPACNECLIGNVSRNFSSHTSCIVTIPTIFFLAKKMMQIKEEHPSKQILFLISACPLSLHFFAPWAHFLHLQGASLPLSGPVCAAFSFFKTAEGGEKRGVTYLLPEQEDQLLALLALRKKAFLT